MTTPKLTAALDAIRALAAERHSVGYIANALNLTGVPTLSGKRNVVWHKGTVAKLAAKHGIRIAYGR